jgi:hypothetical protein
VRLSFPSLAALELAPEGDLLLRLSWAGESEELAAIYLGPPDSD